MKKNFFYSVMALCVMLFAASCSQEEIPSNGTFSGKTVVSVNVPGENPDSRAVANVEGYVMRCIMEAVNSEGTVIGGTRMVAPVIGGKATFEFEKNAEAAQYLFWADYVEGEDINGTNTIYKADALTAVTLRLNKSSKLFNNAAVDAFCAAVATDDLAGSVTLNRPLTRIAVKTADLAGLGLSGLNKIEPNINQGGNYNVATKEFSSTKSVRLNDNETLETLKEGDLAFFYFAFQGTDDVNSNTTIKFYSDANTEGKTLTITTDQMKSLNGNTSVSLKPDGEKVKVEIDIDNSFEGEGGQTEPEGPGEDPQPAGEVKVGAYINAAGEVVETADNAIAVVFSMAEDMTDNSNYGEGKQAKAYAVALKNATGRVVIGDLSSFSLETTSDDSEAYSGFKFDAALKAKLGEVTVEQSKLFNSYYTVTLTELTGEKLSAWYIPSKAQLADALQCEQMKDVLADFPATGGGAFICASSSVNNGQVSGVTYTKDSQTISGTGSSINRTASAIILPVLTIFE